MAVRSTLHAGRPLPTGKFLVLISVRGWVDSRAVRIRSIEESINLIGNRPRDLPGCSIVPQPTTFLVFHTEHFLIPSIIFIQCGRPRVSVATEVFMIRNRSANSGKGIQRFVAQRDVRLHSLWTTCVTDRNISPVIPFQAGSYWIHLGLYSAFVKSRGFEAMAPYDHTLHTERGTLLISSLRNRAK
jgi:hypothetical protein